MGYWINQIGMVVFATIGIFLLNCKNRKLNFYGSVCGFLGQPFWFWAVLTSHPIQIGMLVMTTIYTISYGLGIYNFRPGNITLDERKCYININAETVMRTQK